MKLVAVNFPHRAKEQKITEVAVIEEDGDVNVCVCAGDRDHWQPILSITKEGKIRLLEVSDYYGFLRNDDRTILIE